MAILKIDTSLLGIKLDAGSQYTLTIEQSVVKEVGNNFSPNPEQSDVKSFTTFALPIGVESASTSFIEDSRFSTTATVNWDRVINLNTGNFYIYNSNGVYRTIPVSSSTVAKTDSNSLRINIFDTALPEGDYWLGWDAAVVKDIFGINTTAQTTDSELEWSSQSMTSVADDDYNTRIPTKVFENWYDIIDRSSDSNEQYTIRLQATSGTFTSTVGVTVGNTWTYTGSKQQIEAVDNLFFNATTPSINWDLPVSTQLIRDGVTIATRSNNLIGLPFDLRQDRFIIVSNSFTNIISSSTVLTVTANTTSQFNGIDSGYVTFKAGTSTIGISTFSNNISTLIVPAGQLPIGTYSIFADWAGKIIPPKYNGTLSNTISQTILPKSTITFVVSSIADFFYHNLDGVSLSQFTTATVRLSNIYPNAKPSGTINIYDGSTLLGSDTLELEGNTSTGVITWTPATFGQLDQGTRNIRFEYLGDDWNSTGTTISTFAARTRRQAILNLTSNTTTYVRPTNITLNVATTATFNNKQLSFATSTGTFGSGTFNSSATSFTFNARTISTGSNSVVASFSQDFSFVSTNSNNTTFTVLKGTPDTAVLTYSNTNTFTQPILLDLNLGNTPAKGTSTYILEDVSPYTIRPVAVEFEPFFPGIQHLTLKFDPIDKERITELNFRFGNPGEDKLDLLFNNQPVSFVPGSTVTTYAYIYNPYYANNMNDNFPDDYYLEIWRGTNQLGDSADPNISPLLNTATWLSLSTGTLSLRIQGTTATQYPTTSTVLETKTLIDQISTSSYLTIPVGNWKISNNVGSDPDSNYNSPISPLIHINRKELLPNFVNIVGVYYNDSDPSGGTNSVRLTFDVTPNSSLNNINNKLWDIPNEFLPNRNISVKFYYRWLPTSTTPLPASTSTSWQQGDLWNEYSFSANTPSTPLGSIPRLTNINADGDTFSLLLSEGSSPPAYPFPIFGRPQITVSSQTYFIDGFFFEINYSGSNATATTAAVPGRVVRGYVYYTGNQEVQTNAIITYNSTS